MPSSSLPPPFPPSYSPFPFEPPRPGSAARRHPLRTLSPSVTDGSLSILSCPSLSSIQARQCLPPPARPFAPPPAFPLPFLSRRCRFPFLSRSLVHTPPKCPSFSPTLLCDAGGGSGTAGRSGREVAPFAASRNLARCSFAVHREERKREREREREREIAPERRREREGRGKGERDREKPRG